MQGLTPVSLARWPDDPAGFAQALGSSLARFGFAVLSDHGLPQPMLDAASAQARALFALPAEVKLACRTPGGAGQRGYTPFGLETAKGAAMSDLKEFWHVGRDLPTGHPHRSVMPDNLWPERSSRFKPAMLELYRAFETLGDTVLRAIARHLGLADNAFADPTRDGDSILRLLHYPPTAADAAGVRAGAHEDIDVITLLLGAEEAGLELLDRNGRWVPVNPAPGSVVCNIGDMLQRLTNHVLPSTRHRVTNPTQDRRGVARYSMPFFLHFRPDFLIRTLPSCVTPDRPDRYPEPITAHAYLQQRLREIGLA